MLIVNCREGEQIEVDDRYLVTVVEVRDDEIVVAISAADGKPVEARCEVAQAPAETARWAVPIPYLSPEFRKRSIR